MRQARRRIAALRRNIRPAGAYPREASEFAAWERALPPDAPERLQAATELAEWYAQRQAEWGDGGGNG